jgi:cell wall assembly regulator SMI1
MASKRQSRTENVFDDVAPPLSQEDLQAAERAIGFGLPSDLRRHYLKWNGGIPRRDTHVDSDGIERGVQEFIPIKHHPEGWTIENKILDLVQTRKLIPDTLVPFAVDYGGNFFCVSREDQSVVYYAMDTWVDARKARPVRIASSLEEFIDGLVERP